MSDSLSCVLCLAIIHLLLFYSFSKNMLKEVKDILFWLNNLLFQNIIINFAVDKKSI